MATASTSATRWVDDCACASRSTTRPRARAWSSSAHRRVSPTRRRGASESSATRCWPIESNRSASPPSSTSGWPSRCSRICRHRTRTAPSDCAIPPHGLASSLRLAGTGAQEPLWDRLARIDDAGARHRRIARREVRGASGGGWSRPSVPTRPFAEVTARRTLRAARSARARPREVVNDWLASFAATTEHTERRGNRADAVIDPVVSHACVPASRASSRARTGSSVMRSPRCRWPTRRPSTSWVRPVAPSTAINSRPLAPDSTARTGATATSCADERQAPPTAGRSPRSRRPSRTP